MSIKKFKIYIGVFEQIYAHFSKSAILRKFLLNYKIGHNFTITWLTFNFSTYISRCTSVQHNYDFKKSITFYNNFKSIAYKSIVTPYNKNWKSGNTQMT